MFKSGPEWQLPPPVRPRKDVLDRSKFNEGLHRLGQHSGIVSDFPGVTDAFLRESNIDDRLRALLRVGCIYHAEGLERALLVPMSANVVLPAEDIIIPRVLIRASGRSSVNPHNPVGVEVGTVIGIVGARFATDLSVTFEGLARRLSTTGDIEEVLVVGIIADTGLTFFHPDFIKGQPMIKTVEQVCPPKYLTVKKIPLRSE